MGCGQRETKKEVAEDRMGSAEVTVILKEDHWKRSG